MSDTKHKNKTEHLEGIAKQQHDKINADLAFMPLPQEENETPTTEAEEAQHRNVQEELERTKEELLQHFTERVDQGNRERFSKAMTFAEKAHKYQKRVNGDPYITHPIAVCEILMDVLPDEDSLCAALLHDTVEDTGITLHDLEREFGSTVSMLVDGVTKLEKMSYSSREELQAENYRKMFLAMAKDLRVVLIKLADRMHNMRTMRHMVMYKQEAISQETLDIYAPLADRLGVYRWKWELEDLCLRYIDPTSYYELVGAIGQKRTQREAYLKQIIEEIDEALQKMGIEAKVDGRAKHFYSVYRKMKEKNKSLDQIFDLFACRILVNSIPECYATLGQVHEMYRPMTGRFKDYIAVPKPNHYQSLHTTVFGPSGYPFEVQIRTHEMHETAELGIAAHWKYKMGVTDAKGSEALDAGNRWLTQFLDWQKETKDFSEYLNGVKGELLPNEVYVFTPRGDVYSLPKGSVPIDLAYAIHSGLGNRMYGAKVNGNIVAQDYQLQVGDIVEILASDKVNGPSYDWLNLVKSQGARNRINNWFKKERREENIRRGKKLLEKEIARSGFNTLQVLQPEFIKPILKRYTLRSEDDLYAAIGNGTSGMTAGRVTPRLRDLYLKSLSQEEREGLGYFFNSAGQIVYRPETLKMREALESSKNGEEVQLNAKKKKTGQNDSGVEVKGIDNCLVRLSRCCSPMPGDPIIGYITVGRGVAIHRKDCPNIRHLIEAAAGDSEEAKRAARLIDANWSIRGMSSSKTSSSYLVTLNITAHDRPNLFADVSNAIAEERVSIISGKLKAFKDISALLTLQVEVNSLEQYNRLIGRIRSISDVLSVQRV